MRSLGCKRVPTPATPWHPRTFSRLLFSRYLHNNIASGQDGVHRVHDGLNVNTQHRPLLLAKDHTSDLAALEVLLVSKILVSGNQYFKTSGLSRIELRCRSITCSNLVLQLS